MQTSKKKKPAKRRLTDGYINVAVPIEDYIKLKSIKEDTGRSLRHILSELIRKTC